MNGNNFHIITSKDRGDHAAPVEYYFQMSTADAEGYIDQDVLPAVFFDIIFPKNRMSVWLNKEQVEIESPFVSPVLLQVKKVVFQPNSTVFGIRIKPEYSRKLFDANPRELFQGPNNFFEVVSSKYNWEMEKIVYSSSDFEQKCNLLNELLKPIKTLKSGDSIRKSLELIKSQPWLQVKELSEKAGFSTRWLEMQFRNYLGTSPSEIIKIVRLNRFLNGLQNNPSTTLTNLALEAGYYDQSHLIRDFKHFCSESPGWYKKNYSLISKIMNHL